MKFPVWQERDGGHQEVVLRIGRPQEVCRDVQELRRQGTKYFIKLFAGIDTILMCNSGYSWHNLVQIRVPNLESPAWPIFAKLCHSGNILKALAIFEGLII